MDSAPPKPATLLLIAPPETIDSLTLALSGVANLVTSKTTGKGLTLAQTVQPDVVVIDSDLPGGINASVVRSLRQTGAGNQQVVLALARNDNATIKAVFDTGADDCILKPINPTLLKRRVMNLIQMKHLGTATADTVAQARENEAKYRYLFDSANDAIFIVDAIRGRVLDVNRQAVKWLGYEYDELIDIPIEDIEADSDVLADSDTLVQRMMTNGHFIFEQAYRHKSGYAIPAEVSSRFVNYEGRRAVLNFVRDITRRKHIEREEREQRLLAEALRDTAAAVNGTLQLDGVIERLLEQVTRVVPASAANVMLLEGDTATVRGHIGYVTDQDRPMIQEAWDTHMRPNLRYMLEHKQALVIADTRTEDANWRPVKDDDWVRSYVAAPIIISGDVIGFVNADHHRPNMFTERHAHNLMAFADHVSIAVQNASLHEATQRYAEDLEQRVAERTGELVSANKSLKEQIIERKRVQSHLDDERKLLRTLIDNIPDQVYIQDIDGPIITTNQATLTALGVAERDLVEGRSLFDLLPDDLATLEREIVQGVVATREPVFNREITTVDKNGESQWLLATRIALRDTYGDVVGIVGIQRDISDLRRADEALTQERNLLRTFIDNVPDEIFVKDLDGRFILSNAANTRRLKHLVPDGEVLGSTIYDYMDAETAAAQIAEEHRLMHEIKEAVTTERQVLVGSDDSPQPKWMLATTVPLYDSDGEPIGLVGINRDITRVKQAESRMSDLISGAYCLLWDMVVYESDGRIVRDMHIPSPDAAMGFLPIDRREDENYADAWTRAIILEDYQALVQVSNNAVFGGKDAYNVEFRCHRADGEIRWLREEVKIRPMEKGRFHLIGVCTDVTERKQAEVTMRRANELLEQRVASRTAELQKSNETLRMQIGERERAENSEREQRMFAEALSDVSRALSETLSLDDVLDRMLAYISRVMPPHEAAGVLMIEENIHVRSIRFRRRTSSGGWKTATSKRRYFLDTLPILRQVYETLEPVVLSNVDDEPTWLSLEHTDWVKSYIAIPIVTDGALIGFLNMASATPGQFTDVHAQRVLAFSAQAGIAIQNARLFETVSRHALELEERVAERTREVEHERSQLHVILNAMTEGVIFTDSIGRVRYTNQSLVRMTGHNEQAWMRADDPWKIIYADDNETPYDEFEAETSDAFNQSGTWAGEARVQGRDGGSFDAAIVSNQVTNSSGDVLGAVTVIRDISAAKVLEAQKSRFIATASHELRTPITNLKTRLYLLERKPETLERHMPVLVSVTDRMRRLVDDLLDIARFQSGIIQLRLQDTDVKPLIEAVAEELRPVASGKKQAIHVKPSDADLVTAVDPDRLTQVFTNLVSNAINYTPEGGTITIEAEARAVEDAPMICIEVCDTGVGIPEDLLPEVFKPFFRVDDHTEGTGLGLSITHDIVTLHGGSIEVTSEHGVGTCFEVTLPVQSAPPLPAHNEE